MSLSRESLTFARECGRLSVHGGPIGRDAEWRGTAAVEALKLSRLTRRELANVGTAFVEGLLEGLIGRRTLPSLPAELESIAEDDGEVSP